MSEEWPKGDSLAPEAMLECLRGGKALILETESHLQHNPECFQEVDWASGAVQTWKCPEIRLRYWFLNHKYDLVDYAKDGAMNAWNYGQTGPTS